MSDLRSMFVDSSEQEVATLGGNYLQNFLAGGVLNKGFCTVSNKRVYFKGKCYTKSGSHYKSTKEERTVDLKDITGTGFSKTKSFTAFVLMLISIAWAMFVFCVAFSYFELFQAVIAFSPFIVMLGLYIFYNIRIFEISFAGGKIAFKASNYNEQEMQEFQKSLRRAKDNYTPVAQVVTAQPSASVADELKKYKDLLDSGVISQEEFDSMKAKLLK